MTAPQPRLAFAFIAAATVLGIAGTDLVLPAVPSLPAALGGNAARAQLVLAAFVAGAGAGLLAFGSLGARVEQRRLLLVSLALYALASAAACLAGSLEALIAWRFVQGAAGAAPAVFAPGFIRALYDERGAARAYGLLGSIESLVPALAPIAGAWLLAGFGWRASFAVLALLAALLLLVLLWRRRTLPLLRATPAPGGYAGLLRDPAYLRFALSQACTFGGLLVFVFSAPAVITGPLGGTLADFVVLQVVGIACFIAGANLCSRLAQRFGTERMIRVGSALSALGLLAILAYALRGGGDVLVLAGFSTLMNLGLGLRGPIGFLRAVQAARGDDARGAALVLLAILLITAGGTAAAAPFVSAGLSGPALIAAAISCASVVLLLLPARV